MTDLRFEKNEAKVYQSLFLQVLDPYSSKIIELEIAYGLILDLAIIFEKIYPEYDRQIDEYCQELYDIVEKNVEEIEDEIETCYNSNSSNDLPDFYINTDIFSNLKQPFSNFRNVEINADWNKTIGEMNKGCSILKELSRKIEPKNISTECQDLFSHVKDYIKKMTLLECGDLKLDLERGTLQYKSNKPLDISIGIQVSRFLILLLKNEGKILEYKKVARELDLGSYHKDWDNKDTGEELRYLNRDLRLLLKEVGMTKSEIDSYFSIVTNVGFRFNYESHNKIT